MNVSEQLSSSKVRVMRDTSMLQEDGTEITNVTGTFLKGQGWQ